jgi:magnesium transporter
VYGAKPEEVVADTIARLIRRNATRNLVRALESLRPADIAALFRRIAPNHWKRLFELVTPPERAAEILSELDREILAEFLDQLTNAEITTLLAEMSSDDAADILAVLPEERAAEILELTRDEEDLREVVGLLKYDPETAGGIMVPDVLALPAAMTAGDAIKELQERHDDFEMVFYVYVVNEHHHLVGVCSLRDLVTVPPEVQLADFMTTDVLRVTTDTDQEEVARIVAQYNLLAVPVVDNSNRLVGMVTVDDVIDVIRYETTEDMLRMAGVGHLDVSERSNVLMLARARIPWLFASFVGGLLAVFVIAAFEDAIRAVAALAAFIPITLGMGGNVGTQSSTIVVRGIALGQINTARLWQVLRREVGIGVLCGIVYGVLLGFIVGLIYQDFATPVRLAATVSLGILASMSVAATVGSSVPLVFERLNIDPAIASGPFVTTSVDLLGILSYFVIAQFLLGL